MQTCIATNHAQCVRCSKHPPLVRRGRDLGKRAPLNMAHASLTAPRGRSDSRKAPAVPLTKTNELSSEKLRGSEGM